MDNALHCIFQNAPMKWHHWDNLPEWTPGFIRRTSSSIGLLGLIVHRNVVEKDNLLAPPDHEVDRAPPPKGGCPYRPDDGYGTSVENPTASMEGAPIGRNMPAVEKVNRNPNGDPNVQMIAQRLLARESFKPAGDQLNITAAAWIQAMVHSWIGHEDGEIISMGDGGEGATHGCPLAKFNFFETKERPDGHYNSKRTQWWDASFVYGQNEMQVKKSRSGIDGKLRVDESNPNILSYDAEDGTDNIGDQVNSWVGITILQIIFLKEHNYCCDMIAKENPDLTDDQIFGYARNITAALVCKIHTVDWTVELLKTLQLEIGMKTNWYGIIKGIRGEETPNAKQGPLSLIQKPKADNKGVPFCLTEEFAAVYRLHPLMPPGLILEDDAGNATEFVDLNEILTVKGRNLMRKPGMSEKIFHSIFHYPCGHLVGSNYPHAMRELAPTDTDGVDISDMKIDMAAIDLYRDRERGIQKLNEFRRQLKLKPFKTWKELTGPSPPGVKITNAQKLEMIYGPAPEGIEKCDLLVGDLYEKKLKGFAISETSFIVFLLMASRRLDSDPYLNEYYDEEHYTAFGLKHIDEVRGLKDLLARHYPDLAKAFPDGHSAFKPIYGASKWEENEGIISSQTKEIWAQTKASNDAFFEEELAKRKKKFWPW